MVDYSVTTVSTVMRSLATELVTMGDHPVACWIINRDLITNDDVHQINLFVASQLQIAHERTCPAPTHGGCRIFQADGRWFTGNMFDSTSPEGL